MAAEIPGEDIYSADSDVDSDTGQTEEIPRFDLGLLHKTEVPIIQSLNVFEGATIKLEHNQHNSNKPGPPLLGPVSVSMGGNLQITIHNQSTNYNTSALMLVPPTAGTQSPAAMMRILNRDLPARARTVSG